MLKYLGLIFLSSLAFIPLTLVSEEQPPKKILVGSPIRQKPAILNEFLESLKKQNQNNYILDYYFIDDNDAAESKELLQKFCKSVKKCTIEVGPSLDKNEAYVCDESTHRWKNCLIWKVAAFKDKMIEKARNENYDYLFLIDSDLVMNTKTIEQLIKSDKEIISNIFWTSWSPGTAPLPQVWVSGFYTLYRKGPSEELSDEDITKRTHAFLAELKKPGVYEVGGLGACTLIKKEALNKGVSFSPLHNLDYWGEDRHFCVRAVALGIPLHVDTHYPSYHIYRESAMDGVEGYKKENL